MRLELSPESCVFVDLRRAGLLGVFGHTPTLCARPVPSTIDVSEREPIDVAIDTHFLVLDIEPPEDMPASDREQLRENLRGSEVLDVTRFPSIELRGRYVGTFDRGRLTGDLELRGAPRRIVMDVHVTRDANHLVARGVWEGRLTDLGIKPFKALLGALKLQDWIRLRMEASLTLR
jgi:hypothetical protein